MKDYSMCRYFKGEKENPFENSKGDAVLCWFYESVWFKMDEYNDPILDAYLKEYCDMFLVSFERDDKAPITLKSLLFSRFAKDYDARVFAVEDFQKWYVESYRGNN